MPTSEDASISHPISPARRDLRDDRRLIFLAIGDVRRSFGSLIAFGVVVRLLSSLALAPAVSFVVGLLLAQKGRYSFGNTDIPALLLSPTGVTLIVVVGTIVFFSETAEVAGIMLMGRDLSEGNKASFVRACWVTAKALPNLLLLGLRQWTTYLLLAVPFLAIAGGAYLALWSGADLNYLVESKPPAFWAGAAIVAVCGGLYAVMAAALFLKWVFSVPFLIFEGKTGRAALNASAGKAIGMRWRIARLAVVSAMAYLAVNALALWILKQFSRLVLASVGDSLSVVIPTAAILLSLHAVVITALSLVANAVAALLVLRLFDGHHVAVEYASPPARLPSRLALMAGVASVGVVALAESLGVVSGLESAQDIQITAHRGGTRDAPENSISAFLQAIDAGADFGELDVQLSKDGQVVVTHDQDLMRLFGDRRKIRDLTAAELKAIDLGSTFKASPKYRGEGIPTLESLLDAVDRRLPLMIEIKVYPGDDTPLLVAKTLELIERKGIGENCMVISLDYQALQEARRRNPSIRLGYLVAESVGNLARLDVDVLSLRSALAKPAMIASATRRHKPVHTWTVDDPVVMIDLWDRGVANVITNDPRGLISRRDEVRKLTNAERLLLRVRYLLTD